MACVDLRGKFEGRVTISVFGDSDGVGLGRGGVTPTVDDETTKRLRAFVGGAEVVKRKRGRKK
jgi:hypothetical protein